MGKSFTNKTQNCQVFNCGKYNHIHIEYKNINFRSKQFDDFADYLLGLEGEKWEEKNKN